MTSPGGANLFAPAGNRTETQAGYDTAPVQTQAGIAVIDEPRNKFYISHTWASELNNPNRLNFKWEYDALVKNQPIQSVTLRGQNVKEPNYRQWEQERTKVYIDDVSVTHDGKCYGSFGKPDGFNTIDLFQANTGRGVSNHMDSKLLEDSYSWLNIRGIRAVAK